MKRGNKAPFFWHSKKVNSGPNKGSWLCRCHYYHLTHSVPRNPRCSPIFRLDFHRLAARECMAHRLGATELGLMSNRVIWFDVPLVWTLVRWCFLLFMYSVQHVSFFFSYYSVCRLLVPEAYLAWQALIISGDSKTNEWAMICHTRKRRYLRIHRYVGWELVNFVLG